MALSSRSAYGQSMTEMTLIIMLVIMVGWGALQLISSNMQAGGKTYAAQYSSGGGASGSSPYPAGAYPTTPATGVAYAPNPVPAASPPAPSTP